MKKLSCLLLALLMVFSLAACGGDSGSDNDDDEGGKKPGKNPEPTTTAAPTEPSLEDLGPWVVTEEYDFRDDRFVYVYDKNGDLVSYEAFDGSNKYRDYKASYTETASGGRVMVIESKHVRDSEFEKDYEMEYDADGKLIRRSNFYGDKVTSEYRFTYDSQGYLRSYTYSYEGMLGHACTRVVNYTFKDGLLMAVEETVQVEGQEAEREYAYSYNYDEEGYLKRIQFWKFGEEGIIDLEKESYGTTTTLRVAEDCDHHVAIASLIAIDQYQDDDYNPTKIKVTLNNWGFLQEYAYPYFLFGMANSSNWDSCKGRVTFTRLDVHLAEQEGK